MAKIVVFDAGERGAALVRAWAKGGHECSPGDAGSLDDSSVILFGGDDVDAFARAASSVRGHVVIDCRTPADSAAIPYRSSQAQELAAALPGARVVKAFNTASAETIARVAALDGPNDGSVYTSGFYCGDDAEAKALVASLIAEINFDPIDCGGLARAGLLENLGVLEATLQATLGSGFAISVIRPPQDRSPMDRFM